MEWNEHRQETSLVSSGEFDGGLRLRKFCLLWVCAQEAKTTSKPGPFQLELSAAAAVRCAFTAFHLARLDLFVSCLNTFSYLKIYDDVSSGLGY